MKAQKCKLLVHGGYKQHDFGIFNSIRAAKKYVAECELTQPYTIVRIRTITDAMITEAIKNADKDQYGQTPIMEKQVERLFPKDVDAVKEHLKTSKMYMLSTYGWRYGTYKAICER